MRGPWVLLVSYVVERGGDDLHSFVKSGSDLESLDFLG
jgi:hypothetical protein